jgi:hypothetical protein
MKERPILFSTPMVQAILAGRKTQTRRIIKPQPKDDLTFLGWKLPEYVQVAFGRGLKTDSLHKFPYGKVGDVLWVRETWQPSANDVFVHFKADYSKPGKGWKPSIHMPKSYARIWLRITNVRVERLHDISEEDTKSEGIEQFTRDGVGFKYGLNGWHWHCHEGFPFMCSRRSFAFEVLWKSINSEQSWDENPWVWVIEFERIITPAHHV